VTRQVGVEVDRAFGGDEEGIQGLGSRVQVLGFRV
jgi:hypothetical protein